MKYLKMFGLSALVVTAASVFAGTALATIVTSPAGTQLGKGSVVKGQAGVTTMHGALGTITCQKASGEGKITDAGSSTETVKGEIFLGTFSECGNAEVTVINTGTSEVHTATGSANGNGILTSTGAKVTVKVLSPSLHCVYTTQNTVLGEVVGGTPAIVQMHGTIPRTEGSFFCGGSGTLTGTMTVTSPKTILID